MLFFSAPVMPVTFSQPYITVTPFDKVSLEKIRFLEICFIPFFPTRSLHLPHSSGIYPQLVKLPVLHQETLAAFPMQRRCLVFFLLIYLLFYLLAYPLIYLPVCPLLYLPVCLLPYLLQNCLYVSALPFVQK